jgi:F0F1-type ATP synthase beta subunit
MANPVGHITQVIGAVVDVQFEGHLPRSKFLAML